MDRSIILKKSTAFSVRIINLCKYLKSKKRENVISEQILRSGTSIGANIAEAQCASSRRDFLAKMQIAYKECSETKYWLTLLKETNYVSDDEYNSIIMDCNELFKMLTSITKTTSQNL